MVYVMANKYSFHNYVNEFPESLEIKVVCLLTAVLVACIPFSALIILSRKKILPLLINVALSICCFTYLNDLTNNVMFISFEEHLIDGFLIRLPIAIVAMYCITKLMEKNDNFKWLFFIFPAVSIVIILQNLSFDFMLYTQLNKTLFCLLVWHLREDLVYVVDSAIKNCRHLIA